MNLHRGKNQITFLNVKFTIMYNLFIILVIIPEYILLQYKNKVLQFAFTLNNKQRSIFNYNCTIKYTELNQYKLKINLMI